VVEAEPADCTAQVPGFQPREADMPHTQFVAVLGFVVAALAMLLVTQIA